MAFENAQSTSVVPDSPDELLLNLPRRKIKGVLVHQGEIMKAYAENAVDAADVALQLPTGSGKTLVGLMIGEWRRRKFQERVVYLCPTRQLVNQVVEQADESYGLTVHGFTGRIVDFEPSAKAEYQNGDRLAVTTYSALFNTNPYFDNADIIVVDDAHAAENYVANMWTLRIERTENPTFHAALAGLLKPMIEPGNFTRMTGAWEGPADAVCVFAIPDDAPTHWKGVMTFGGRPPHSHRGGLIYPLEGNRWMANLGGRHGDEPPGDPEGFLAFARELRTPTIYNAIRHAKPLGGIARYGFPESVLRHFERLETFPRGLLPIADAICRFNPVYGQGMSVAAQEACLVSRLLEGLAEKRDPIAGLAPAFFAEVPALLETPWAVATSDFIHPSTRGQRPADFETRIRFGMALTRLAAEDPAVHRLTAEVSNLLKPRSVYRGDPALMQRVSAIMAQM